MARTLEKLREQYSRSSKNDSLRKKGPGRGPMRFDPKSRPKINKNRTEKLQSCFILRP